MDLWQLDATDLARLIRTGQASAREAIDSVFARLHKVNPAINAVVRVFEEEARAAAEQIGNVTFWKQQPRDRVAQIYAASDLCLVLLRNLPLFHAVIPSKIFEFMGAGRPILTTVDGESRAIVEGSGAGVFSPPENAEALVASIRALLQDPERLARMGALGRAFAEQNYSRPALAARYLEVLQRVAAGP